VNRLLWLVGVVGFDRARARGCVWGGGGVGGCDFDILADSDA
jgi:hypothetical protein